MGVAEQQRLADIRAENHCIGVTPVKVVQAQGIARVDGALHRCRVRSHRLRAAARVSELAREQRIR